MKNAGRGEYRVRTYGAGIALLGTLLLSSCAAAPFLIPVAIEFARNLIQTSLSNYGSKHRDNLSNLVNRLASPYTQPLQAGAGFGPGMQPQQGVPQQGYPGQQTFPGQQSYPGQAGGYDPYNPNGSAGAGYPGAGTYPGTMQGQQEAASGYPSQPAYDPYNNPYGTGGTGGAGYPGAGTYPGAMQGQQGAASGYPSQQGYDPYNNPYGTGGTGGAGYPGAGTYPGTMQGQQGAASGYPSQPAYDPNNPYGATTPQPSGQTNPYGGADPYGSGGYQSQPGAHNPYGSSSPYGGTSTYPQGGQANPYGTPNQPYGTQHPNGNQGYSAQGGQANPYGTAQAPQPYDPNNPYGSAGTGQGYGQSQSAYGRPQTGYGAASPYGTQQQQQAYGGGYGTTGQPYGGQYGAAGVYPRGLAAEPVAVDVAMIRQKQTAKGKEVVLMNDGEVLKGGGANKEAGDKFKVVVRTNCDCYLYIVAIDGSGWAQPVFPGKDKHTANPVKKDAEYAFPEGPYWFSLDQVKGIETFYVVASANRRADLEDSLTNIAAEQRPAATIVAKVEEPPVIPRGVGSVKTRGIITVKDETGIAVQVTPLSYAASRPSQDVTVTRWFKHE